MSSGRGHRLEYITYLGAYVLPAALVWGVLGFALQALAALAGLAMLGAWAYAAGYGIVETVGLPVRRPSLAWQVPASWIAGRSNREQAWIWGAALGPGLFTLNPYAGMWLLPLLVAVSADLYHSMLTGLLLAIAVGTLHASARAFGVLNNRRHLQTRLEVGTILAWQWRWQFIDGLALLAIAGALTVYMVAVTLAHG